MKSPLTADDASAIVAESPSKKASLLFDVDSPSAAKRSRLDTSDVGPTLRNVLHAISGYEAERTALAALDAQSVAKQARTEAAIVARETEEEIAVLRATRDEIVGMMSELVRTNARTADNNNDRIGRLEDQLQRQKRLTELVFRGVPLTGRERLRELRALALRIIRAVIETKAGDDDLLVVEHAHVPGTSKLLVVRFASLGYRLQFYRTYWERTAGLWASEVGFRGPEAKAQRIYAMDSLTPYNAAIRFRAVELRNAGAVSRIRVRDGQICVQLPPPDDNDVGDADEAGDVVEAKPRFRCVASLKELEELVNSAE